MSQNKLFLAYAALGVGVLALSFSAMFVRWADAPGPVIGFYRVLIATVLFIPLVIQRQKKLPPLKGRWLWFPILAGLFTALDFTTWNTAVKFTTAAKATLLGNTAPLWVALIALIVFRERMRGTFWFGLALSLIGAALVVGENFAEDLRINLGDLLASAAAIFYAIYQLITQRGRKFLDPFRYTWFVGLSAAVFLCVINLVLGNPLLGYSSNTWLIFFATAIVSQMIGYLAISYSLGHLPASVVSPTLIAQPILTAVLAVPLLGEIPTPAQWLGGALALAGIYIVNRAHQQALPETPNA
ncbi:MAG: DMT family transporter [Anaerolineales bacterium]|nr:MAG: DMT family transporter [Anaerolineales bacterium]